MHAAAIAAIQSLEQGLSSHIISTGLHMEERSDVASELRRLKEQYAEVCEERDALEDLLLQEQLKNGTSTDKQLEAAISRCTELELELQAMAARCEEWRRRAGLKAAEMNPKMVQMLLEETLDDVDETGVLHLQAEVAQLRDELAKSEVLRFELYKQLQERLSAVSASPAAAAAAGDSKWEKQEEGLREQMEEMDVGVECLSSMSQEDTPRWSTPLTFEDPSSMNEDGSDVVAELLELGQEAILSDEVKRLSQLVEEAELRAEEAEREALEKDEMIELLEAKVAALVSESPLEMQQKLQPDQAPSGGVLSHDSSQPNASQSDAVDHAAGPHRVPPPSALEGGVDSRRQNGDLWHVHESTEGERVEEVKKMAKKIQRQNGFTHFLLAIVAISSIANAGLSLVTFLKDQKLQEQQEQGPRSMQEKLRRR